MTMSSSSVETRDSAIQMLDKFLAVLGKSYHQSVHFLQSLNATSTQFAHIACIETIKQTHK
jgi:hypothetical protein